MDKMTISERIKTLRNSLSLPQTTFALEIGTTQAAVSGWEVGDRLPSSEMLLAISEKYGVSIDWLLGLSDKMYLSDKIAKYPDLLRLLVSICSVKDIEDRTAFELIFEGPAFLESVSLKTEDQNIYHFLTEWKKIYDLYLAETIDREIYEIWLNKNLKAVDKPIDTHSPTWG